MADSGRTESTQANGTNECDDGQDPETNPNTPTGSIEASEHDWNEPLWPRSRVCEGGVPVRGCLTASTKLFVLGPPSLRNCEPNPPGPRRGPLGAREKSDDLRHIGNPHERTTPWGPWRRARKPGSGQACTPVFPKTQTRVLPGSFSFFLFAPNSGTPEAAPRPPRPSGVGQGPRG